MLSLFLSLSLSLSLCVLITKNPVDFLSIPSPLHLSVQFQVRGNNKIMSANGYIVEVTSLSPHATERDVYDFFSFSGVIEHVEIVRSGDYGCTAYVTFKEPHSLETAILLTGATILDQQVCINRWGQHEEAFDFWNRPSWRIEEDSDHMQASHDRYAPTAGEAVTMTQEVVKTMLAKGYVLGKDALIKAKALDESYQVSASAAAKVAELSKRVGLTDKINAGVGAVKSVDEKYHVSEITIAAVGATSRTAAAAANSFLESSYFAAGALWVSDALTKAAKAAADLANNASKK